jgi:hypothetical protein
MTARSIFAGLLLVPALSGAQMIMPPPPTAKALAQIEQVKKAASAFSTPDRAATGGFIPVLNWLPTMGLHWINQRRQSDGRTIDIMAPDQLMFSAIDGKETMVGAAYSYIVSLTDSIRPPTFDGNPPWHDHPQFAPEGKTLAMVHVWFVASPDGPFAGHNPNLPFWALGLTPPDPSRFMDAATSARIRKASLALGVVVDTAGIFPTIASRPTVHAALAAEREKIRLLVPRLDGKGVTDWKAWDQAATEAAAAWDRVRAIYLGSVRTPSVKERMETAMDEWETGHHGHHG